MMLVITTFMTLAVVVPVTAGRVLVTGARWRPPPFIERSWRS